MIRIPPPVAIPKLDSPAIVEPFVCGLCDGHVLDATSVAAFRGRAAHLTCWLEWRGGRRAAPAPIILLVDDDDATRYATHRILKTAGYEVLEACSAAEAFQTIARRHTDLILLDLQLPDLDGLELCRQLKRRPNGWPRVVPFTGVYTGAEDARRALDAGADSYLVKPTPPAQLLKAVHDQFRGA